MTKLPSHWIILQNPFAVAPPTWPCRRDPPPSSPIFTSWCVTLTTGRAMPVSCGPRCLAAVQYPRRSSLPRNPSRRQVCRGRSSSRRRRTRRVIPGRRVTCARWAWRVCAHPPVWNYLTGSALLLLFLVLSLVNFRLLKSCRHCVTNCSPSYLS